MLDDPIWTLAIACDTYFIYASIYSYLIQEFPEDKLVSLFLLVLFSFLFFLSF